MEKKRLPRTHIWLLVICLLFAWSALTVVIVTLLTGEGIAAMLGVAAMELGYAALFLFLWWRHRWVDLTLLAKGTEKKLVRLHKVHGDKALYEVARKTDGPVREEALRRIRDEKMLLKRAARFDTFALEQITDPEMLYSVAADERFFPETKNRKKEKQRASMRKRAAERLLTEHPEQARKMYGDEHMPEEFRGMAKTALLKQVKQAAGENREQAAALCRDAALPMQARRTAVESLLEKFPEQARDLCGDADLPEELRSIAKDELAKQVEHAGAGHPEQAAAFCRDAGLPMEARLTAVEQITDPALLRSVYESVGELPLKETILRRIQDESVLADIIGQEPDKGLRLLAEKRVTDPVLRRTYCEQDGAHDYEFLNTETESTMGTSHIYYYEYSVYRCRYCGRQYREESGSWHD